MGKDERRLVDKKTGMLLTDDELKKVNGGVRRIVSVDDRGYTNVRSGPGMNYTVVTRVYNGEHVNTTGRTKEANGYTWYEIDSPDYGWVVGSVLGY